MGCQSRGARPGVPHVPRSGQGSILHRWRTRCLRPQPGCWPRCAPKFYAPIARFYPALPKFLHQVLQLQQGDGENHQRLGRKKGEKGGKTHPACRASPTCVTGCPGPGPGPCPAARSPASAGSPARPPAGGNWQSSVAPNYTSWVPGPLTPRLRKVNLCSFRPV